MDDSVSDVCFCDNVISVSGSILSGSRFNSFEYSIASWIYALTAWDDSETCTSVESKQ